MKIKKRSSDLSTPPSVVFRANRRRTGANRTELTSDRLPSAPHSPRTTLARVTARLFATPVFHVFRLPTFCGTYPRFGALRTSNVFSVACYSRAREVT